MSYYYSSKIKYPIGTKVYVHLGDILLKGIVINKHLDLDIGMMGRYRYLVKYLAEFKDGLEHADWYYENKLSPII